MAEIKIGTSSFSSKDWLGPFYPEGMQPRKFLKFYAQHFETVEIDATYYRIPSKSMVQGWNDNTPENFIISAKLPRSIVHAGEKATPDAEKVLDPDHTYDDRDVFLENISGLGKRLGTLVLQFPYFSKKHFANAGPFLEKLDRFLSDLPDGFKYGVEIRNRNWLKKDYAELLRSYKVAMVVADQAWMPHGDEIEKKFDPVTSDHMYIRLIGDRKEIEAITRTWEKEVIDRTERLDRWADVLTRAAKRQIDSLVYVNNHYAGHAPETARRLSRRITEMLRNS